MVQLSGAFNHSKADHLKSSPVFKWHLKIVLDFKWMDHLKTKIEKFWFSGVSGIQISSFHIPSVWVLYRS
jgi:hypothetical protein